MLKKIYRAICGSQFELRERIFRLFILVGSILSVLSLGKCIFLMDAEKLLLPAAFVVLPGMVVELLATFKYRRIDLAAIIAGLLIILVEYPVMYLSSGGLVGGTPVWFVLGLVLLFIMFSGKRLIFFVTLALATYLSLYVYTYHHPESITPLSSRGAEYFDSLFSLVVVGLAVGGILKMQMKLFEMERNVAKKQQEELQEVSQTKNNFFASMSHEIRTPINTIIGLNEMILRESGEQETKEYARNIQSASKMLLNLVNDVLDLSQLELRKMEIVPVEYRTADLFEDLIDMIQVRLKEKRLELQVDIAPNLPSVLYGDAKRISQVLLNILTNAVKYTKTGSVTLSAQIESMGEEDMVLRISVTDTGIGIRKEDLAHLYDSFKRVDAQNNLKVEGSGLGLSITKQLVDLMDGEITVDSIYTKGSVFTVSLPQKIIDKTPLGSLKFLSRNREKLEQYQQSFEAPQARILIVDDNEMNSFVASKLLSATKMQIDMAKSGEECLEMTKQKYYHVILMDYLMPQLDGIQTMKQVRRQENGLCRDSAVIVLSATSVAENGRQLLENGFDGYLEKPVHGEQLEAQVLKFLPEDIIEYRYQPNETENVTEIQKISRHKRKKIYITTDCVCDLPDSMLEKYDIGMMYLYIKTETGRFADTREIDSDNLVEYMTETSSSIIADSVSVEEYEEFFAEVLTQAEQVIHISMAKNAGKSYGVAVAAAQGFDHVHVIDSTQISCGQGLVVLYAAKLAMEGCGVNEICDKVNKMKKRVESFYIMPSAKVFYQHGYTNAAVNKICNLLQLHPVVKMSQSKLVVSGVGFGRLEGAMRRFIHRYLFQKKRINTDVLLIAHAGCSVRQQEMIQNEAMRCIPFKRVMIQKASVSTACNSGIGTFGFAYYVVTHDEDL